MALIAGIIEWSRKRRLAALNRRAGELSTAIDSHCRRRGLRDTPWNIADVSNEVRGELDQLGNQLRQLADQGSDRAIHILTRDPHIFRKELVKLGGRAVPAVVESLNGMDFATAHYVASNAVGILAEIGDASAVVPLIRLLPRVRKDISPNYVVVALGKLCDKRAIEPLQKLLSDERWRFQRRDVAAALGQLGQADGVDALLAVFDKSHRDESDEKDLRSALWQLEILLFRAGTSVPTDILRRIAALDVKFTWHDSDGYPRKVIQIDSSRVHELSRSELQRRTQSEG